MNSYKILTLVLIIFCLASQVSYGQKIDGYIVLNSGDTIKGQIKQKSEIFKHVMYQSVVFFDENGNRKTYDAEEIESYKIAQDEYFKISTIRKRDTVELLAKRIISGPCELYEYWFVINMGPQGTSRPQQNLYLKKEDKLAHLYKYRDLLKGREHFFADMPDLNFDIRQKKYHRSEIEKIVKRYNQQYNN